MMYFAPFICRTLKSKIRQSVEGLVGRRQGRNGLDDKARFKKKVDYVNCQACEGRDKIDQSYAHVGLGY